jgi:hypothetical protein
MCHQEVCLVLGEASYLAQLSPHDLTSALLLRLTPRTLPDSDNGWTRHINKTLHGFDEVILKASAAQLSIGEDIYTNAVLTF